MDSPPSTMLPGRDMKQLSRSYSNGDNLCRSVSRKSLAFFLGRIFPLSPRLDAAFVTDKKMTRCVLLRRGANTGATDAHGNTPSEWAATVSIRRMISEGSHRQESDLAGGDLGEGGPEEKRGGSVEREAQKSGALRRLSQRLVEIGEAEEGLVFDLQRLAESLQNLGDDREVGLDDKGIQLAAEVMSHSIALSEVHVMLRSQILSCDGCAASVAGVFEDPNTSAQLAEWHSRYEAVSSRLLLVLHSLAGGLVVGDRAVGEIGGEQIDPRVAAEVAEVLDLLRLPTQRLMKYQSFLGIPSKP